MGTISCPIGLKGWVRVTPYSEYEQRVQDNIETGRYLEAMVLAGTCLDALLYHIVDGLSRSHKAVLDPQQLETLKVLRKRHRTAGPIIDCLEMHQIIDPGLAGALRNLNKSRNWVIHPFSERGLKRNAIVPGRRETRTSANRFGRDLSKVIELAGGLSLRKRRSEHHRYSQARNSLRSRLKDG